MPYQETMTDVPPNRLETIRSRYQAEGATVQVVPQADGTFTVTATFNDVPWSTPFATESVAEITAPVVEHARADLPQIRKSGNFADIAEEYQLYFNACTVRSERQDEVDAQVERLLEGKTRYKALGDDLRIPWYFIGIIHSLETDFNFGAHLHNGDPLTARTKRVPAGRPLVGDPPFTWEESARDALAMKGFVGLDDWSTPRTLFRWENYNGTGYRTRGLASPYLWSFSQLYDKGRFVRDHEFDPEAKSEQCGAAVLLKTLLTSM